jgi:hypothetical protein
LAEKNTVVGLTMDLLLGAVCIYDQERKYPRKFTRNSARIDTKTPRNLVEQDQNEQVFQLQIVKSAHTSHPPRDTKSHIIVERES